MNQAIDTDAVRIFLDYDVAATAQETQRQVPSRTKAQKPLRFSYAKLSYGAVYVASVRNADCSYGMLSPICYHRR